MGGTAQSLAFLGGAETVTGSRFLVTAGGDRLLVDAGMFQGERAWRTRNWEAFPVDPASVDAIVLTHAHLDHCGFVPVLARDGFTGPVLCTPETARLTEIVLRDAAHLQEQEALWSRTSGLSRHAEPRPLFDARDAERAIDLLRPISRHRPVAVGNARVELHRAGHILGSSFVRLVVGGTTLVFSGDLGRVDHPLLLPPETRPAADHVVVEATYGDRLHSPGATDELAAVLTRALRRGGAALLPAFAVDRTPMLLHEIRHLVEDGRVPDVPVYVDSPMALRALDVYRSALRSHDSDFRPDVVASPDPFDPGRLRLVAAPEESEKLNAPSHPCIVVSASGMATGGRVLHHLAEQLPDPRNTVVLTGYQVAGTRGRALADGAAQIKIHGRYVPVRAEVANIRGFSAHADTRGLLAWLAGGPEPRTVYVVHGEPSSAAALAQEIRETSGWTAVVPRHLERVRLD